MHAMHFSRVALAAVCVVSAVALASCSDDDTIIALNVAGPESVGYVRTLKVRLTQAGESPIEFEVSPSNIPPEEEGAGATRFASEYEQRITVPASWGGDLATVEVSAIDGTGAVFSVDTTEIRVREGEAVAAFVEISREDPGGGGGNGGGGNGGGGNGGGGAENGGSENGGSENGGNGGGGANGGGAGGTAGDGGSGGSAAGNGGSGGDAATAGGGNGGGAGS